MKEKSGTALQFSGYPLKIAESKERFHSAIKLKVVKKETYYTTIFIQKNNISNDPHYWDEKWFGNYE